jgi:hypothetical protein
VYIDTFEDVKWNLLENACIMHVLYFSFMSLFAVVGVPDEVRLAFTTGPQNWCFKIERGVYSSYQNIPEICRAQCDR